MLINKNDRLDREACSLRSSFYSLATGKEKARPLDKTKPREERKKHHQWTFQALSR